jgi:hypothetical protein
MGWDREGRAKTLFSRERDNTLSPGVQGRVESNGNTAADAWRRAASSAAWRNGSLGGCEPVAEGVPSGWSARNCLKGSIPLVVGAAAGLPGIEVDAPRAIE